MDAVLTVSPLRAVGESPQSRFKLAHEDGVIGVTVLVTRGGRLFLSDFPPVASMYLMYLM